MDNNVKVIAFYLPQFYPTKENDIWWGKGFTEWTNVAKAKPLFKGHNQPHIPSDLGFYDLRVAEVREQQVELAKKAGVTAFCYWHYWFGNGKRLLERVFDEVLTNKKPDFPFCLGWANHSWYAKTWNKKDDDRLLIQQTYPGLNDAKEHFDYLLKAFKDSRYLKIDNKPFFYIFDPRSLPKEYIVNFRKWTIEAGFDDLYLVANINHYEDKMEYLNLGYSAVVINRVSKAYYSNLTKEDVDYKNRLRSVFYNNMILNKLMKIRRRYLKKQSPIIIDYVKFRDRLITEDEREEFVLPQIIPQWDHTPRSGVYGCVWINTTPHNFYLHAMDAMRAVQNKTNQIILLKSWNEWGEGNYMEPDSLYGGGYIDALHAAIYGSSQMGEVRNESNI